ncbi:MAG: hypothetical protein QOD39_1939, partial [Mycobacterium sp.]|nr:hypothetical protein [Mycobacterium sp.]
MVPVARNMLAGRAKRTSLVVATTLGGGHAAVSIYWFFGTRLLDTVGGSVEEWAVQRGLLVTAALVSVLCLKLAAVLLGVAVAQGRAGRMRVVAWVAASILSGYGTVNTVTAQLMLHNQLATPADASHKALSWHAWVWDPWFMLWGLAMVALLVTTRTRQTAMSSSPP